MSERHCVRRVILRITSCSLRRISGSANRTLSILTRGPGERFALQDIARTFLTFAHLSRAPPRFTHCVAVSTPHNAQKRQQPFHAEVGGARSHREVPCCYSGDGCVAGITTRHRTRMQWRENRQKIPADRLIEKYPGHRERTVKALGTESKPLATLLRAVRKKARFHTSGNFTRGHRHTIGAQSLGLPPPFVCLGDGCGTLNRQSLPFSRIHRP